MQEPRYDVFLSFSGADRDFGRSLARELRGLGSHVFVDEDSVENFSGITESILDALRTSRTFVAYYSVDYADRAACQHELMTVFLAGQREGDPCGRIMVINPEPATDHLYPVEVADAKFVVPAGGVGTIARDIVKRAARVEGRIGDVGPVPWAQWPTDRSHHLRDFVGRYRELWELHSALHATDFPLITEAACGPFAAVCGLPGAGKTALVTAYSWRFAAAFPGGVTWLSLAGTPAEPGALRERYGNELRRVAGEKGIDVDGQSAERVVDTLIREVRGGRTPSLWVVDDIPSCAGADVVNALPLPADGAVRTILISEDDIFRDHFPVVRVGPLPAADAVALLDSYRAPDDDADRAARTDLVLAVGGHAGGLTAVGDHLRDRQGLTSYRSFTTELDRHQPVVDAVFGRLRTVLDRMTPDELTLLRFADESRATRLAASELRGSTGLDPYAVGTALKWLRHRSVADHEGTEWHLDPYVLCGARHLRHAHG